MICAWTSVRPNVPLPSKWQARWNKLNLMFLGGKTIVCREGDPGWVQSKSTRYVESYSHNVVVMWLQKRHRTAEVDEMDRNRGHLLLIPWTNIGHMIVMRRVMIRTFTIDLIYVWPKVSQRLTSGRGLKGSSRILAVGLLDVSHFNRILDTLNRSRSCIAGSLKQLTLQNTALRHVK